jgi:sugar (pentulose or hexulose) kinase
MESRHHSTPRGIAVVDVGYTNTKVILFSSVVGVLAERKMPSPHRQGPHYGEIDVEEMLAFFAAALPELDAILPIDSIVTSAHGACIVAMAADGALAVPVMDYMSQPPPDIERAYRQRCPDFAETYSPQLPLALLHAMQLFWQSRVLPSAFAQTTTILPLMQYVAHRLGGRAVSEISSMGCQSHLLDLNNFGPSQLAIAEGWSEKFAPRAKAWDVIGTLRPAFKGDSFRGRADILAGVHDSNANLLRYLASGTAKFTLLSTGTWIIGFDSETDIRALDPARDTVANVNVLGRPVASCRFFGGKEFESLNHGAPANAATLAIAEALVARGTFALPSFSDGGGPFPNTGGKGRIIGPAPQTAAEHATLASLYCALMVSESLDAIHSRHDIIVDGPFSQNGVFLALLAALRPGQTVKASELKDGTAAGAACLALMPDGELPRMDTALRHIAPTTLRLAGYQAQWRRQSAAG